MLSTNNGGAYFSHGIELKGMTTRNAAVAVTARDDHDVLARI
jgi:hypothetical protein